MVRSMLSSLGVWQMSTVVTGDRVDSFHEPRAVDEEREAIPPTTRGIVSFPLLPLERKCLVGAI